MSREKKSNLRIEMPESILHEDLVSVASSRELYLLLKHESEALTPEELEEVYLEVTENRYLDEQIAQILIDHEYISESIEYSVAWNLIAYFKTESEYVIMKIAEKLKEGKFKEDDDLNYDLFEITYGNESVTSEVLDCLVEALMSAKHDTERFCIEMELIAEDEMTSNKSYRMMVKYCSHNIARGNTHFFRENIFEENLLITIIRSKVVSGDVLAMIYSINKNHLMSDEVEWELALKHTLPLSVLQDLAFSEKEEVRSKIARKGNLDSETLDVLSCDDSKEVQYSVAKNKNTLSTSLDNLIYEYQMERILKAVRNNRNVTVEQREAIRNLFRLQQVG